MDYLDRTGRDVRALGGIRIAAVGPGTASELRANGLRADLVAHRQRRGTPRAGAVRSEAAREGADSAGVLGGEDLTHELERGGVPYTDVRCYETRILSPDGQALRRLTEAGAMAAFTSASTVRGLCRRAGRGHGLLRRAGGLHRQTDGTGSAPFWHADDHRAGGHAGRADSSGLWKENETMELVYRPRRLRSGRNDPAHVPGNPPVGGQPDLSHFCGRNPQRQAPHRLPARTVPLRPGHGVPRPCASAWTRA